MTIIKNIYQQCKNSNKKITKQKKMMMILNDLKIYLKILQFNKNLH